MTDANHLVQRHLVTKTPKTLLPELGPVSNSEQGVKKILTCEKVSFKWWSKVSHIAASQVYVWGTNMAVVSEGLAYTLVFHPGGNIAKIIGIHDRLEMSYCPKIGWWSRHELEMNINGTHTWTISGPCAQTGVWRTWSTSFVIPNWFKGKASDVRFHAR